jgi:quercetin dioxygenase-like cupin family protein
MSDQDLITTFDLDCESWQFTSDRDANAPALDYFTMKVRSALLVADDALPNVRGYQFAPNFYLPVHFHDVEQVALVVQGELSMGQRRVTVGAGAFTPAGNPYGFTAGADGVTILEFRTSPGFRTAYTSRDLDVLAGLVRDGWMCSVEGGKIFPIDDIPGWTKPVDRGHVQFFDASAQNSEYLEAGPARAAHRHPLIEDGSGSHGVVDLVTAAPGAVHQWRAAATAAYCLAGTLTMGDTQVNAGSGFAVAMGAKVEVTAGPQGARWIEYAVAPQNLGAPATVAS